MMPALSATVRTLAFTLSEVEASEQEGDLM